LTLPILVGQTAPPAGWRQFTPKDGGFTVALPSVPKEKKQQVKSSSGTVEIAIYTCEPADDVVFVVGVTDYPNLDMDGGEDKRLRNARDGALENSKGKLIHERKITLAGHPGREMWIQTEGDGMIHTRLYSFKQRLLQTMAIGPKTAIETKMVAAFMDSLKLKKK
jgi:hypothetical protein